MSAKAHEFQLQFETVSCRSHVLASYEADFPTGRLLKLIMDGEASGSNRPFNIVKFIAEKR